MGVTKLCDLKQDLLVVDMTQDFPKKLALLMFKPITYHLDGFVLWWQLKDISRDDFVKAYPNISYFW